MLVMNPTEKDREMITKTCEHAIEKYLECHRNEMSEGMNGWMRGFYMGQVQGELGMLHIIGVLDSETFFGLIDVFLAFFSIHNQ